LLESVTVSENGNEPVAVGVPESVPDALNVNHDGSVEPLLTVQL
jgi:hypothetical protein